MGEAKRRQEVEGDDFGKEKPLLPWLPITESQIIKYQKIANRWTYVAIILVVATWVIIRFIGPTLGLWKVVY